MSSEQKITPIRFTTTLFTIGGWTILSVPESASAKLPSRGQVMVEGTFNGIPFRTPLEPDGKWNHWCKPDAALLKASNVRAGDSVTVEITPTKDWPEPDVPADLQRALNNHKEAHHLWKQVTPLAHWEWIRWIRATNKAETRAHRVEVACSKLKAGTRRPCCWNRNMCTEPHVSKNGVLREPDSSR